MRPQGFFNVVLFGALMLALSACSGGGVMGSDASGGAIMSGPDTAIADAEFRAIAAAATETARPVEPLKYDAKQTELLALNQSFYMAPAARFVQPLVGTATYNGIAAFKPADGFTYDPDVARVDQFGGTELTGAELLAKTAMTVDFATSHVKGAMWDFHDKAGNSAAGSVQLAGTHTAGDISASGPGTLDWGSHVDQGDINLTGRLVGDRAGLRKTLSMIATSGGETTTLDGRAVLKSDGSYQR